MRLAVLPLLLAACTSCATTQVTGLSSTQQHNQMVKIVTTCDGSNSTGSGVLVDGDVVITANHVVGCRLLPDLDLPIFVPADKIVVISDGVSVEGVVERTVVLRDLARVRLSRSSKWSRPQRIGAPPRIGDRVCEVAAHPRGTYRCGEAQESEPGHLRVSFLVEPGNSGSAIYNASGEIVGIITDRYLCPAGSGCGGRGTLLAPHRDLVPESR